MFLLLLEGHLAAELRSLKAGESLASGSSKGSLSGWSQRFDSAPFYFLFIHTLFLKKAKVKFLDDFMLETLQIFSLPPVLFFEQNMLLVSP